MEVQGSQERAAFADVMTMLGAGRCIAQTRQADVHDRRSGYMRKRFSGGQRRDLLQVEVEVRRHGRVGRKAAEVASGR